MNEELAEALAVVLRAVPVCLQECTAAQSAGHLFAYIGAGKHRDIPSTVHTDADTEYECQKHWNKDGPKTLSSTVYFAKSQGH